MSGDILEILGMPQSIFVRTTRMALEEKGVAYKLTPAMPHSPEICAIHPFGRIPAMRHGDVVLFESRAIIAYADHAFDGPSLIPEDPKTAGEVEQWASALTTTVIPSLFGYLQANAFPRGPDGKPARAVIDAELPLLRPHFAILERAVSDTGYLAAGRYSLADMYLLPSLAYLRQFPESSAMLRETKALERYCATHSRRANFVNTDPPPMSELRLASAT